MYLPDGCWFLISCVIQHYAPVVGWGGGKDKVHNVDYDPVKTVGGGGEQVQPVEISITTKHNSMGPTQQYGPWIHLIHLYIKLPIDHWFLWPLWLRSMPFKGPGVSKAPSPPLAHVIHSPLWNLLYTGP